MGQTFRAYLEPCTRLWRRLQRISQGAVRIVSLRAIVAGTVCFTAGLHPHDCVDQVIACVSRRAHSEPGSNDVAPVSLFSLFGGLDAAAAYSWWYSGRLAIEPLFPILIRARARRVRRTLVDDKVGSRPSGFVERGSHCGGVFIFVVVGVGICVLGS